MGVIIFSLFWLLPVVGYAPPSVIEVSSTSALLKWAVDDGVTAYEVEVSSVFDPRWRLALSNVVPIVHVIEVRTDFYVQSGWFQLSVSTGVTEPIPYDASASTVRAALEAVETVESARVERCDSARWACPDASRGAYSWRIEFSAAAAAAVNGENPALGVWKETIGPGVASVWRGGPGKIHASQCGVTEWTRSGAPVLSCEFRATGLAPGDLVAFRLAATTVGSGRSEPSPASPHSRLLPPERPPPRPPAPVEVAPGIFRVAEIDATAEFLEVQHRTADAWFDAIPAPVVDGRATIVLAGKNFGGGVVETRCRGVNAAGKGDWSSASLPGLAVPRVEDVAKTPPEFSKPVAREVSPTSLRATWTTTTTTTTTKPPRGSVVAFEVSLQRGGGGGEWGAARETRGSDELFFVFEGLEPSETYRVRARAPGGNWSAPSDWVRLPQAATTAAADRRQAEAAPRVISADHESATIEVSVESSDIEMTRGDSEDFRRVAIVKAEDASSSVTISGLAAETLYRFRARRALPRGVLSAPSAAVAATTLAAPTDEWTTTLGKRARPSPRRGHTLTVLGNQAWLFGGRGPGYECDSPLGSTFRLGSPTAGRPVERCRSSSSSSGASSELWRLDDDGGWTLVTPKRDDDFWPPARAHHVAANLGDRLVVWGGDGETPLADFWQLEVVGPISLSVDANYSTSDDWRDASVDDAPAAATLYGPVAARLPKKGTADISDDDDAFRGARKGRWTIDQRNVSLRLDLAVEWTELAPGPPPTRDPVAVAVDASLFLAAADGLWRYESGAWTRVVVKGDAADGRVVGIAATLTPLGLFATGGLDANGLDRSLWWMPDLRERKWRVVRDRPAAVDPAEYRLDGRVLAARRSKDAREAAGHPRARYYAALAFLPPNRLLLVGGRDDASDLDDVWLYALNTPLPPPMDDAAACDFRFRRGGASDLWNATCGAPSARSCSIFDLLIRASCRRQYQSITHFPR